MDVPSFPPTCFSLHPHPNQRLHHSCPLFTSFTRTSAYQASFFINCTHLWNSLLDYVVRAPSATSFKCRLKSASIFSELSIITCICTGLFVNVLLLTLLCLNISYVVNFYLPLVSFLFYLPGRLCTSIRLLFAFTHMHLHKMYREKKKCCVTSGRKKVDTCVEDLVNKVKFLGLITQNG